MLEVPSILIVEDDESWLDFCVTMLAKQGFQVAVASNGLDALPKLKSQSFDIVLTDHVAPGAAYGSMTEAVKAACPRAEVIVMTGLPTIDDAVFALRQGAADYLGKPFTRERLQEALQACEAKRLSRRRDVGEQAVEVLERIVEEVFIKMLDPATARRGPRPADFRRLNPALLGMFSRLLPNLATPAALEQTRPFSAPAGGLLPPQAKLGRYEIVRELGHGTMGRVYLARDPRINRLVAVKTLSAAALPGNWEAAELQKSFYREAECAGRLTHPNIVKVFDAGEEDGCLFIVMEFLEGRDLRPFTSPQSLLPPAGALSCVCQAAQALDYAHRQGVVHRDIKPANLMLVGADRSLRITDFGVASLADASETLSGVIGSPYYMSPERIGGRKADGRADQFSLGVVLYELVSGERPWRRKDSIDAVLHEVAHAPHRDILELRPDLPPALAKVIDKALGKPPESRYGSCAELSDALACVEF